MNEAQVLLLLLGSLQLKHFFADFCLKTPYMLRKGWGPLVAHCSVHAVFTFVILLLAQPSFAYLALLDFLAHLMIDKAKQSFKLPPGVWPDDQRAHYLDLHYFVFGLDQLAHHLTYLVLVYWIYGR